MGKIKKTVALGSSAVSHVSRFFSSSPTSLAAFAKAIPSLAGRRLNVKTVSNYVRQNPINSILTLSLIPEAASLIDDLYSDVPGLEDTVRASMADDTISTLGEDRETRESKLAEAEKASDKAVMALSIADVMNFKDEAQIIKQVIATMPGRSDETQLANLMLLRRVISMPDTNFKLFNTLQSLGE